MPFSIGWYAKGLLVDCTGRLDTGASKKLSNVVTDALDTRSVLTDVVLDWRGCSGDPMQRHLLTKQVAQLLHPNLGRVAAVDNEPMASFRIDLMCAGKDYPYLACTSLEEAVLLLERSAATTGQPIPAFQQSI